MARRQHEPACAAATPDVDAVDDCAAAGFASQQAGASLVLDAQQPQQDAFASPV